MPAGNRLWVGLLCDLLARITVLGLRQEEGSGRFPVARSAVREKDIGLCGVRAALSAWRNLRGWLIHPVQRLRELSDS